MTSGQTAFQGEEWRPTPEYPGYEVSSEGRVRSHVCHLAKRTGQPVIIGETYLSGGYRVVGMKTSDGKRKVERVHRLVASVFCQRRPGQWLVRHLNDVRTDNRADNLAWGSDADNKDDAIRNGKVRRGEKHHGAFISDDQVREIYLSKERTASVARRLGVSNSYACCIRTRRIRADATEGLGPAPGMVGTGGVNRGVGAKITPEIAVEIFTSDAPAAEMARKFGVSEPYIHRIRGRVKWRSVTDGLERPQYRRSLAGVRVNADGSLTGKSITGQQAVEIFLSVDRGRDVAQRLGITEALVSAIRNRHQWSHVTKDLTPPERAFYWKHKSRPATSTPLGVSGV